METVGLFEAKTHLSELIARAERGEETIITRHNKPVAKIVPIVVAASTSPSRRVAVAELLRSAQGRRLDGQGQVWRDEGRR